MKILTNILGIISIISILSTLICGLWIRANNVTELSSIKFHSNIGILSVILVIAFIVVVMISKC